MEVSCDTSMNMSFIWKRCISIANMNVPVILKDGLL